MERIEGLLTNFSLARDNGETHYWVIKGCKQCGHHKHSVSGGCMHCSKLRARKNRAEKGAEINLTRRHKYKNDFEHRTKILEAKKEHYVNNKEQILFNRKLKRYDLSENEYIALLEKQNGICANEGCNNETAGSSRTDNELFIDHCHKTKKVRGLLCMMCNLSLGNAKDDEKILKGLAKYLQESRVEASATKNT